MDILYVKELLEKQFGDTFQFHPKFFEEFHDLVVGSGEEAKVIQLLLARLIAIMELGNIDYGLKWLERLKEYNNMYSLHINTNTKNFRLLFSKSADKKYFLHMFYEKSGKGISSYSKHVPIAIHRRDHS